ncbi:MAG: chemotaxis protein CheX [Planctomycetes bacterium]|jgi:CheY-specific phosphatase CheX|nr:chemotaxis protein CheX [Planctomycetota bacterium]MCC7065204.1 chemotaxis protein CheX [Planctomycetota bacterium]
MSTITAEDFQQTAANALERMAFVFTEPAEETVGETLAQCTTHAKIEITGDQHSAWVVVSASRGFLAEVAASMMGVEQEEIDVDEHAEATVHELANVLGGELVMAMGGAETPLRLSLPATLDDTGVSEHIDAVAAGCGWTTVLKADSGFLLLACCWR